MVRVRKTSQERNRSQSPLSRWTVLFVFGLAFALYSNTLGHDFVFDDDSLILQNPQVRELRWGEILSSGGYRPIRTLTYAVNYALGGEEPFGFHLFNVLLHAVNAALLFRLLLAWTGSFSGAALGALLFALHPAQTAAVAYISGRKDLLAAFFLLSGLALYTHYRKGRPRKGLLVASLSCFLLAILSKEVALIFPALLFLADTLILPEEGKESFLSRSLRVLRRFPLPYAAAVAAAAAGLYYALFITQATRATDFWGGSWTANLGTSGKLFLHYLKLVVWPDPLIADYSGKVFPISTGLDEPASLLSLLVLAAFPLLAFRLSSARPRAAAGMLWFLAALIPVLQFIPFHELAADHFLYVPLLGVALLVSDLLPQLLASPRFGKPVLAGAFLLLVLAGARTWARNADWKDSRTLWTVTYRDAPESYRAALNLGRISFEMARARQDPEPLRQGIELTEKALALQPDDVLARSNLGAMYFAQARIELSRGNSQKAEQLAHRALELLEGLEKRGQADGAVLNNLGSFYAQIASILESLGDPRAAAGDRQRAQDYFEKVLASQPGKEVRSGVLYNYALLARDLGQLDKATRLLEEFLELSPEHPAAHRELGSLYLQEKEYEKAARHFETLVRLAPSPAGFGQLAETYWRAGEPEKATEALLQSCRRFPRDGESFFALGQLLYLRNNFPLARTYLEQSVRLLQQSPAPAHGQLLRRAQQLLESLPPS